MASPARKKAEEQALERIRRQKVASRTNTYTTKSGDTLGDIAKQLGVTVSKLKEVNQNLVNIKSIPKGLKLNIPTKSVALYKGGLKKPTNPGLKKLPTPVRNKMGYMHNGGSPSKGKKGVMVISIGVGKMKNKPTTKKKKGKGKGKKTKNA